jgi:DNA-binding transcriptional regulator YiaG
MTPQQVRTIRERLGLTQAQLAEALDVQPNTVARWERGELPISRVTEFALKYLQGTQKRRRPRPPHKAHVYAGATL